MRDQYLELRISKTESRTRKYASPSKLASFSHRLPFPANHLAEPAYLQIVPSVALQQPKHTMPADEYAPVVRGALKLKGSAPSGIKKKKKKPKTSDAAASSSKKSALQSALEEEDAESSKAITKKRKGEGSEEDLDEEALRELEERGGDGKTASERAYEEMRRKRVCFLLLLPVSGNAGQCSSGKVHRMSSNELPVT